MQIFLCNKFAGWFIGCLIRVIQRHSKAVVLTTGRKS